MFRSSCRLTCYLSTHFSTQPDIYVIHTRRINSHIMTFCRQLCVYCHTRLMIHMVQQVIEFVLEYERFIVGLTTYIFSVIRIFCLDILLWIVKRGQVPLCIKCQHVFLSIYCRFLSRVKSVWGVESIIIMKRVMSTNRFFRESIASKKTRKAEEKTKVLPVQLCVAKCSHVWQNVAMCGKMPECLIRP